MEKGLGSMLYWWREANWGKNEKVREFARVMLYKRYGDEFGAFIKGGTK